MEGQSCRLMKIRGQEEHALQRYDLLILTVASILLGTLSIYNEAMGNRNAL